jgi:hypothetical protein
MNFGGLGALGLGDTAVFGKVKSHTISEKPRFGRGVSTVELAQIA